jgi:hypothetical protein
VKTQITRVSIRQTSKVVAILYAIIAAIVAFFMALFSFYEGEYMVGIMTFILSPLIYGVFGYIGSAIVYWIYNGLAKRIGGVEFQMESHRDLDKPTELH